MERFNLEEWLKDKSRKVVTKDGRPVRIICWDRQSNDDDRCIVGLVDNSVREDTMYFDKLGHYSTYSNGFCDLFFSDEDELTEFENAFGIAMMEVPEPEEKEEWYPFLKKKSTELLDLARNEILKSLPKWKKSDRDIKCGVDDFFFTLEDDGKMSPYYSTEIEEGQYYISEQDLLNLPKEE